MTPESYLAVTGGVIAVGGALTAIVRVIVEHATDAKFDVINDRMSRIERRHALLEQYVKGSADTFTREVSREKGEFNT